MSNENTLGQSNTFAGFSGPNYTQVPDALFDELLPVLSGAELKVLLYVIRRTFGFKREADTISLGQMVNGIVKRDGTRLDHGTGVTKKTLLMALRSLEQRQILFIERRRSSDRGDEASLYRLNVIDEATRGVKMTPGGGTKLHQGGGRRTTPGGEEQNYPTQDTGIQDTVLQETDVHNSNIRKVEPGRGKGREATNNGDRPRTPEGIGAVLARSHGATSPSPVKAQGGAIQRPEAGDEDFQRIQSFILDRQRELGDRASAKSSCTRAWNLYQAAGCSITRFEEALYKARSLTQESTAQIKTVGDDPNFDIRRKIKMPYFFAVLEDVLGLRTAPEKPIGKTSGRPQPPISTRGKGADSHGIVPYIES